MYRKEGRNGVQRRGEVTLRVPGRPRTFPFSPPGGLVVGGCVSHMQFFFSEKKKVTERDGEKKRDG